MDARTILGILGVFSIAGLALVGVAGFVGGTLFEPPDAGSLVAPSVGSLVVSAVVVGALTVLGARAGRWRVDTPYW